MTATRWRKRPVEIDAIRFVGDPAAVAEWCGGVVRDGVVVIPTLEGDMVASPGDYIIRGVQGEHYPCRADIFLVTYEPA